jgi:hypothetical protein
LVCAFINQKLVHFNSDFKGKIPGQAGVRILSLDGGNAVRGIVQSKILEKIETMTRYKV